MSMMTPFMLSVNRYFSRACRADDVLAVLRVLFVEPGLSVSLMADGEALEFWTHDERQATAAISCGLTVRGVGAEDRD